MRTGLGDGTVIQHDNTIGFPDGVQAVRDHQHGPSLQQSL